jgi:hypothetical protein
MALSAACLKSFPNAFFRGSIQFKINPDFNYYSAMRRSLFPQPWWAVGLGGRLRPALLTISAAWAAGLICGAGRVQADELKVGDAATGVPGEAAVLPLTVDSTAAISGMQFELVYATGQAAGGAVQVSSPNTDHKGESREVNPGRLRCVVFSPTGKPLTATTALSLPLFLGASSPTGGPDVTIQNLRFVTTGGTSAAASPAYGAVTNWRKANFTPAELADGKIIGDNADPDGDGVANLVELAGGSAPKSGSSAAAPNPLKTPTLFSITYPKSRTATGVTQVPQVSADLRNWTEAPAATVTGGDATTLQMTASVSATGGRQFLRLLVRRGQP